MSRQKPGRSEFLHGLVVVMINWGRNVDLTPLYLSILPRLNIELYKVTRNHKVTFCLRNSQVMPDQSSKIDIMCNLADVSLLKWFSCRSWWRSWQDKIFQFHPWDYQFIINQSVEGINVNISCLVHWGPWVNAVLGNNANNIKNTIPSLSVLSQSMINLWWSYYKSNGPRQSYINNYSHSLFLHNQLRKLLVLFWFI